MKHGRPKTTMKRTLETEIKEIGMKWSELEKKAKDGEELTRLVIVLFA